MFSSLTFWTLVAGVVAFVVKFFWPSFPLDNTAILSAILFLLGLFGVVPTVRAIRRGILATSIFGSMAFWELVVGLVSFVIHYFAPTFPLSDAVILALVVYVVGLFGITPELRMRGLLK
jgi:uncharacterized membrane protein YqjE